MTDREHKIRERAYNIWEDEGHPHGRADDHWLRAAREVEEMSCGAAPAPEEQAPVVDAAQPADAVSVEKPAPRRRKAAAETDVAPKTKSRSRATATRKSTS